MGFLDRLLSRSPQQQPQPQQGHPGHATQPQQQPSPDEQAIRRYQYLLQTADPADLERVHTEAFAKLTPQQRQEVLQRLSQAAPDERITDASPQALGRAATRAELRRPGTMQTAFGGYGGLGRGGSMMPGLFTSIAGTAVGLALGYGMISAMDGMFGDDFQDGYQEGYQDGQADDGADQGTNDDQGGYDDAADTGLDDSGDMGADLGDFGGDF